MAKKSKDVYGGAGQTNLITFDPDTLVLVTDESNPLYDPRVHLPVDENLARNINYQGVLQPVSVSKNPETGETEVVAGRQRVKAARLANQWRRERGQNIILVPGIVYAGKRQSALDAIVSENEGRQDDTPLGRAEKMRRQMATGRGEDQIAVIFNCSVGTVRSTLALLDCPQAVQNAVESGQINITHVKALAKLTPDEQRAKVAELVAAGEGARPHERARRQRAVLFTPAARMRTRKEIEAALKAEDAASERAQVLRWVLNLEPAEGDLPGLAAGKAALAELDAQIAEGAA